MPLAITLHILAAVVWVGGMFFAYLVLRPVAGSQLEPAARLPLWTAVFGRFFPWIWLAIVLLLASGFWMISAVLGGMAHAGTQVHLMMALGIVMMLIFLHVYFAPYRRLKQAVGRRDWPEGARQLGRIRILIGVNLVLGLLTVCVAAAGAYLQ